MIKIITAIGNPNLNNTLRKYEEFNIIGNDILYTDGIIELIKKNQEIDYLIVGENYKNEIEELIYKVRDLNSKIKIIIIISKNNKEINNLYKLGISELFYEDENIENIINYLKTKNIEYLNIELRDEINNLKKIILENNKEKKVKKTIKNICIGMVGPPGIGKTTSCVLFAKALNKNNKILIIDFNLINSQIGFLYNKKIEYSKINEKNINDLIINADKNIDILIGLNLLKEYNKIDYINLLISINELKNTYDYIFVDTFFDTNFKENKKIFNSFDFIFLHSGINELEINKTEKITQKISEILDFNCEKIKILLYKIDLFELIKIFINKKYFKRLNIIGIIKKNIFIKKYLINENKLINKLIIKKIMKNI